MGWSLFENKSSTSSEENNNIYKGEYTKLDVSGPIEVLLKSSNKPHLEIEVPDEIRQKLRVSIQNGVASVRFDRTFSRDSRKSRDDHIQVIAYGENLEEIKIGGEASLVSDEQLEVKKLRFFKNGPGTVTLDLETSQLILSIAGNGKLFFKGSADHLHLSARGSFLFLGRDLEVENAEVFAKGSPKIELHVNENLKVNLSGSSRLLYKGEPKVKIQKTSGSSSVKRL